MKTIDSRDTYVMGNARTAVIFCIIYFFIFSPRLDLTLVLHTGFLSVALLALLVAGQQPNFFFSLPKQLVAIAVFFIFLALYHTVFAFIYGNEAFDFFSICVSVVINFVFGWMLASYFVTCGLNTCDLIDQLLVMCTVAVVLNSLIILIEFAFPEIKIGIESLLLQVQDANINYAEHPFRLRGVASGGGSALSVLNAIAIVFIIYLVINKKMADGFALFGGGVIALSNIFTGRTGLIFGLLFLFILLTILSVKNLKSGFVGVLRILIIATILLFLFALVTSADTNLDVLGWAFEWVDGLLDAKIESESSDDLKSMLFLPDDAIHLLFGVGFFEGVGKIYPRTDSGYLKSILSAGLPLSVLLYGVLIFLFLRINKVSPKYFWLVLTVLSVLVLVEVKEPIFYQNFAARVTHLLAAVAMFILEKRRTEGNK